MRDGASGRLELLAELLRKADFEVRDEAAIKELFGEAALAESLGGVESLACHPATTTHRQLGPDELVKAGVSEDMVRLSIGIEHVDDQRST